MTTLSKSKFMEGLSCHRLLWCEVNAPEKILPFSAEKKAIFDQGHEVGELAQKMYPKGVLVDWKKGFKHTLEETKMLVKEGKTIFEASFGCKNAYCRVDILVPSGKEWDLIEVKSSSKVKDEHIPDVAFQLYCLLNSDIHVRKCYLMCIDTEYVRKGDIDIKKFFHKEDITDDVLKMLPAIESQLDELIAMVKSPEIPAFAWEGVCEDISDCRVCKAELEKLPENNVTQIGYFGKKAYSLLNQGITLIKDIPADFKLTDKQKIQKESAVKGKTHIDKTAIKAFLSRFKRPLYLLDFETVNPAVPLFDGLRPYQVMPFQLSLHVMDDTVTHYDFLAGLGDPRNGVIEALKKIGPTGTVLAYNSRFERDVIEDLITAFPSEKHLHSIIDRIIDLGEPFSQYQYYNPLQRGKWSLKAVLPALTGKDYSGLEIQGGSAASRKFLEMTYKLKKQDDKVREALLRYCEQDTQAMIDILRVLEKVK